MQKMLGIDIGGTGIKGALIDVSRGELITERIKYPTPRDASPEDVIATAYQIVQDLGWQGQPVGIDFPAIVKHGVTWSASNVDNRWIGYEARAAFQVHFETPDIVLLNDADAAGIAEMTFGHGRDREGVVLILTIGTGIGSALFVDHKLVPNTELGHLLYKESKFEDYMANSIRERDDLSWKSWGKVVNRYLEHVNFIFSPDLILIGGGVSKKFAKYEDYLKVDVEVKPAMLRNNAGIIGAAMLAHQSFVERR